jgi:O-methyltransferase
LSLRPRTAVKKLLQRAGYDLVRQAKSDPRVLIPEMGEADSATIERVRPFTMTSLERIWSCIQSVRYVSERGLEGDFVECGVWRGGSSMAAALTFQALGDTGRTLWLFDTFEGMTAPVEADFALATGQDAAGKFEETKTEAGSDWCYAGLDEVQANLASTGYPADRVRFIKGPVEETLAVAANLPEKIAILRLDTDWYESTKAELETLFDRLVPGGVLIIDDYGHWAGAKKAVDEFLAAQPVRYMLHRIDETGRALIKA